MWIRILLVFQSYFRDFRGALGAITVLMIDLRNLSLQRNTVQKTLVTRTRLRLNIFGRSRIVCPPRIGTGNARCLSHRVLGRRKIFNAVSVDCSIAVGRHFTPRPWSEYSPDRCRKIPVSTSVRPFHSYCFFGPSAGGRSKISRYCRLGRGRGGGSSPKLKRWFQRPTAKIVGIDEQRARFRGFEPQVRSAGGGRSPTNVPTSWNFTRPVDREW